MTGNTLCKRTFWAFNHVIMLFLKLEKCFCFTLVLLKECNYVGKTLSLTNYKIRFVVVLYLNWPGLVLLDLEIRHQPENTARSSFTLPSAQSTKSSWCYLKINSLMENSWKKDSLYLNINCQFVRKWK